MEHWKEMGKEFGYPQCCIDQFCSGVDFGRDEKLNRQERIHQCYGFIPCDKHAEMIDKGEITLESLIENRTHPIPFPRDITDTAFGNATVRSLITRFKGVRSMLPYTVFNQMSEDLSLNNIPVEDIDKEDRVRISEWLSDELRADKPTEFFVSFEHSCIYWYIPIENCTGKDALSLFVDMPVEELYSEYKQIEKFNDISRNRS